MEYLPSIEEYMPPYEGYITSTLLQIPSQKVATEAEAPIRQSSRKRKASSIALGSREQEPLNWNKAFRSVQYQQEEKKYYEAMHKYNYKIQENMKDPLDYLDSYDPDTI